MLRSFFATAAIFLLILSLLVGLGLGLGWLIHWLLPTIDAGSAALFSLIATIATIHFFGRLSKLREDLLISDLLDNLPPPPQTIEHPPVPPRPVQRKRSRAERG